MCVPPAPNSPTDLQGDAKRTAWLAWSERLMRHRAEWKAKVAGSRDLQQVELAKCRLDPAYLLAMYGWIYEPRDNPGFAIVSGRKQWIPFEGQVRLLRWVERCMTETGPERNGVASKSRTWGMSWIFCLWGVHGFLFKEPWHLLYLSRVEDLVESKNHDSLFWKIDFILRHLPDWMLPADFKVYDRRWDTHLSLINPVTHAELTGESTTGEAGRGGRYTAVVVDEAAKVPELNDVLSGVSPTTFHWFLVSSESRKLHSDFYNIGIGNRNVHRPALFEADWWHNPLNTTAFIESEQASFESRGRLEDFFQEYLRDTRAGGSNFVYPAAADIDLTPNLTYDPQGFLYASIDPGRRDHTAIVWIQEVNGYYHVLGSYQNSGKEAAFYGSIITGKRDPRFDGDYTFRDEEFMAWTASLPTGYLKNRAFFGDVDGEKVDGVSKDSWYSVLRREYGIHVNADRMADGQAVGYRAEARQIQTRVETLRQMLPNFRFSDRNGAPFALRCLAEYQYAPETGKSVSEQKAPLHNEFSHMATAIEYYAVHIKLRYMLMKFGTRRAKATAARNARDLAPHNPNRTLTGRKSRLLGVG